MRERKNRAIDLMVEYLHSEHNQIRCNSRGEGCEQELDIIKRQLLDYLNFLRKTP